MRIEFTQENPTFKAQGCASIENQYAAWVSGEVVYDTEMKERKLLQSEDGKAWRLAMRQACNISWAWAQDMSGGVWNPSLMRGLQAEARRHFETFTRFEAVEGCTGGDCGEFYLCGFCLGC